MLALAYLPVYSTCTSARKQHLKFNFCDPCNRCDFLENKVPFRDVRCVTFYVCLRSDDGAFGPLLRRSYESGASVTIHVYLLFIAGQIN